LFAILVTISGSIYEGYSHSSQAISELAGTDAEHPLLQTINFFMTGLAFMAFAVGLHRGIGGGKGSVVGPALVFVFGASSGIGNGIFPCDSGCDGHTAVGFMHNLTGLVGFLAGIASIFVISRRFKGDPDWRPLYQVARIFSVATLITLVMWIGIAKIAEIESMNGILQRLYVGVWLTWTEIMAFKLFFSLSTASIVPGDHNAEAPAPHAIPTQGVGK
jgi:hypothetical membrane protein